MSGFGDVSAWSQKRGHQRPFKHGDFTVDFVPNEGAPVEKGVGLNGLVLVVAIGAFLLGGALGLAALTPVSGTSADDQALGEARMITPSSSVAKPRQLSWSHGRLKAAPGTPLI